MEISEIYVWGSNQYGQLGLGEECDKSFINVPMRCSFGVLVREISCGDSHAGFIANNGLLYTMGNNSDGQLGNNTDIMYHRSPVLIDSLAERQIIKISFGGKQSAALTADGEVFTWGCGNFGALGLGDKINRHIPSHVRLSGPAISISMGSFHFGILIIDEESKRKRIFMCGNSEDGQLGNTGSRYELLPIPLNFAEDIRSLVCGHVHTGLLTNERKVYMLGNNNYGQLGNGDLSSSFVPLKVKSLDVKSITKISLGHFSAALTSNSELYI